MLYITDNHASAENLWALCADGRIIETFDTHLQAVAGLCLADHDHWSTLLAAGPELQGWASDSLLMVGVESSDRRVFEAAGGTFRQFPLPLMAQTETDYGHDGAFIVGRIDTATISGDSVPASGVFDSSPEAMDVARLVEQEMLNRVSGDFAACTVDTEITELDQDGWPINWVDHYTAWEMMGATILAFSAFDGTEIHLTGPAVATPEAAMAASGNIETVGRHPSLRARGTNNPTGDFYRPDRMVMLADGGPAEPPVDWFNDPALTEATALVASGEGRVFGHIAAWETCHIGHPDVCITPPHSAANYGYFTTGHVRCEEGCDIPTGVLSIGGGHADERLNAREAAAHYDNSTTAIADVAVGEDDYGIWVAGALRPSVTAEQVRAFRGSSPSGDWRRIDGNLELVACLGVNVPGFPVPRTRLAAGQVQTLIAAVAPRRHDLMTPDQRIIAIERRQTLTEAALRELAPDVLARIRERAGANR